MPTLRTEHVTLMPSYLEPGILYVSLEYGVAAHLCACGCGTKVVTPLSPTDWRFSESRRGPSLWPSIGNWQLPCRSHYVIRNGKVVWAGDWTEEEIQLGRVREAEKTEAYYRSKYPLHGFFDWLNEAVRRLKK
ncbi:MAG: DUF6527 family protein [Rectinemataceae bacterium]